MKRTPNLVSEEPGRIVGQPHAEFDGKTLSYVVFEDFVIFCGVKDAAPSDEDWTSYVESIRAVASKQQVTRILAIAGDKPPTAQQRSQINQEARDGMRVAIVFENRLLKPIVNVFSWFLRDMKTFGSDQVLDALDYLGVTPDATVMQTVNYLLERCRHK